MSKLIPSIVSKTGISSINTGVSTFLLDLIDLPLPNLKIVLLSD